MNNLNDANTATIRTTWLAVLVFLIAWAVSKLTGNEVSTNDPQIILWGGAAFVFFQRAFTLISKHVPWAGYLLFGVNRLPGYTNPPPALPALAEPPPEDKGALSLQDVLVITAIVIVVLFIAWAIIH